MRPSRLNIHLLHVLSKVDIPQTPLDLLNQLPFKDEYKTKRSGICSVRNSLRTLEKNGFIKRTNIEIMRSMFSFWRITDSGRYIVEGRNQIRASSDESSSKSAITITPSPPHINILLHSNIEGKCGSEGFSQPLREFVCWFPYGESIGFLHTSIFSGEKI